MEEVAVGRKHQIVQVSVTYAEDVGQDGVPGCKSAISL